MPRLALGRLVVLGQHLDEHRDVGGVSLLMAEPEVVHDRAGLRDRRSGSLELACEPLETSDSHQAARLHEPARVAGRFGEDLTAAGERGLHGLGAPERDRGDVPADEEGQPFIPCLVGVRESALLQVGRFDPAPVSTPRRRRALAASRRSPRLLEVLPPSGSRSRRS